MRQLLRRMRKQGDEAVIHRLRGRPSNRKIAEPVRRQAVGLVKKEYRDFGPTLASEYLAERHGLAVSRETLRGWMIQAGLWRLRLRRVERVHTWRPQRSGRRQANWCSGIPASTTGWRAAASGGS